MSAPGGILCLDLSSVCGVAYGPINATGSMPWNTSWALPKIGGLGIRGAAYENEMIDIISLHQPQHIVMEAPLPAQGQASTHVALQQLGLAFMTEVIAYRHDVKIHQIAASTVRKHCLGTARFPKGTAKENVMAYCKGRGWNVANDHAADAILVYLFAASKLAARERLS